MHSHISIAEFCLLNLLHSHSHTLSFTHENLCLSTRPRQVTALAELLPGWQFVWVPAMTFAEGGQEYHAEGLAVFSRHPIVDSSFVRLRYAHDSHSQATSTQFSIAGITSTSCL
jgi:hypothetical protein